MATNGHADAFAPVLAALATLQSNADSAQKSKVHSYLEQFQKSSQAWDILFSILYESSTTPDAKLFAATSLKSKIILDLYQVPPGTTLQLRDSVLELLIRYRAGPKPIRTQLSVCLANLALQMTEWKDVLPFVVRTISGNPQSIASVLEFIHVLPEEVTEGRKINLTEDELRIRTSELLEANADLVVGFLNEYTQSSPTAAKDPQALECVSSWLKEVALNDIVNGPLIDVIFNSLFDDGPFETGVECLCAIFKETRDVDESLSIIQTLYPRVVSLKPRLQQAAQEEDTDTFMGLARIFAEAGESWVVLIARTPDHFSSLVDAILETAARDQEHDAISMTFNFWFEFKLYLTLDKYAQARLQYAQTYSKLVDILLAQLEYPKPENDNEKDPFEGDRDREEKFRSFRHRMGDVLKDSTEVIGVTECLAKSFRALHSWYQVHGSAANAGKVPEWQKLEAALFSFRALGQMVPPDENIMLPQLIPIIVQTPDHEKIRFQAVMALGRYTEWTAQHPDTLQPQFNYITAAFDHPSKEIVTAAALSMRFFCIDCAVLLKDFTAQLQRFYENVFDRLPFQSRDELTEGVVAVIAAQAPGNVFSSLKMFCDPLVKRLVTLAQSAASKNEISKKEKENIADYVSLITVFFEKNDLQLPPGEIHPAVHYCQEIFPILSSLVDNFGQSHAIQERICRCWRFMVLSYGVSLAPLLPQLAEKLASGFINSQQGCFLWTSDAIIREFAEDKARVDKRTTEALFHFYQQQATNFLRVLNQLPPEDLPDVIEDFFRFSTDVYDFYPSLAIPSSLTPDILRAACHSLQLLKTEPLISALHFLRDFLAFGGPDLPVSMYPVVDEVVSHSDSNSSQSSVNQQNPPEMQQRVQQLIQEVGIGDMLVQRCLTGMMYSFPPDCIPDSSGVLLALFEILPQQTVIWVAATIELLPEGSINMAEKERLIRNVGQRIESGDIRKIRTLLQDFTNSYRRRNVAPREGLGRLEAGKFRFGG
ncbi:MAG: Nuclear import receptor [Bogoriella megaspora]|nr:MAG: Nuclear import receptor [Bogoriella megaspora]